MSQAVIHIQDSGVGVTFAGQINFPADHPTPAHQVAAYLAAHQEQIARESWAWFAAQNVARKTLKGSTQ